MFNFTTRDIDHLVPQLCAINPSSSVTFEFVALIIMVKHLKYMSTYNSLSLMPFHMEDLLIKPYVRMYIYEFHSIQIHE
jgi:hypothetical protein